MTKIEFLILSKAGRNGNPGHGCNGRPQPTAGPNKGPITDQFMKIIVNGEIVPDMETAIDRIKSTMSQIITPPCEPGSKFSQFNSVVNSTTRPIGQPTNKRPATGRPTNTGSNIPRKRSQFYLIEKSEKN